jgi:Putative serine esterase (DUF676)
MPEETMADHRTLLRALTIMVGVLAIVVTGPRFAVASVASSPVILVHGYEADSGADCTRVWNDLRSFFQSKGWTGPLVSVAYYVGDINCDVTINEDGKHDVHYAAGHEGDAHTTQTNIRHLGYHLAWWIYDQYTRNGRCVDAIGHSMGGLIIRYAIAQVENGNSDFPPSLCVRDAVTLGTPHAGTPLTWACGTTQCVQMRGNLACDGSTASSFIRWLRDNAWDPDGTGGTQWTLLGSDADLDVPADCAVGNMGAFGRTRYLLSSGVSHTEYLHLTSTDLSADVVYKKGSSGWTFDFSAPWPLAWARLALGQATW